MASAYELNTPSGPAIQSKYGPVLLADLFDADTERGILTWRHRPIGMFVNKRAFAIWNARFPEKSALDADNGSGYKSGRIFGRRARAHRVLFAMSQGHWPPNQIDHINGMKYDNRAENLRAVSLMENNRNVALPKNNASGIMGVRWNKLTKKWQAEIGSAGKSIHLGSFADLAEATAVRKAAELAYGFHANHGRAAPAT